jgi:cysteine desulfurase
VLKSKEKSKKIYLDYAASVSPNPSSIHLAGVEAKKKLENARKKCADVLYTQPRNIIFTSGGTESNNLAIQGIVASWLLNFSSSSLPRVLGGTHGNKNLVTRKPNIFHDFPVPHIITTNIEHPSVLETFKMLAERKLAEISIVPVEANGIVDPKKIKKEIKNNTVLVSVMYVNNEIGTIQPIKEIAKEIRHYKKAKAESFSNGLAEPSARNRGPEKNLLTLRFYPFFHTDAVQAANYLDLNVEKLGVDLLSLSGSKIEGAGRVGLLYKRNDIPLVNIFGGGDQENGFRPGTENLPEIIKFVGALEQAEKIKVSESKRVKILRDYFLKKILKIIPGVEVNGEMENRLPNNLNITIPKIPSDLLVIELSAKGIYVSEKSACKSGSKAESHVIQAISCVGKKICKKRGSIRFSLGRNTTKADIDYTLKSLSEILKKLEKWYN